MDRNQSVTIGNVSGKEKGRRNSNTGNDGRGEKADAADERYSEDLGVIALR